MKWKLKLPEGLAGLERLLQSRNSYNQLAASIREIKEDADSPTLLLIAGEFNAGKSTFINALLGEPLLTVDITPATAVLTKLTYGTEKKIIAHFIDGTSRIYGMDWLEGLSAERTGEGENIRRLLDHVEVQVPNELLKRVHIVDSPGFNSNHAHHTKTVRSYLRRADFAFWLFFYRNVGTASELQEIEELKSQGAQIYGIVNAVDLHDEEEDSLQQFLSNNLRRSRMSEFFRTLIGVSAKEALEAKLEMDPLKKEYSNWAEIEHLMEEISADDTWKAKRVFQKLNELLKQLNDRLMEERSSRDFFLYEELVEGLTAGVYPELVQMKEDLLARQMHAETEVMTWKSLFDRKITSLKQAGKMWEEIDDFSRQMNQPVNAAREWRLSCMTEYERILESSADLSADCMKLLETQIRLEKEWETLDRYGIFKQKRILGFTLEQKKYNNARNGLLDRQDQVLNRINHLKKSVKQVEVNLKNELSEKISKVLEAVVRAEKVFLTRLDMAKEKYGKLNHGIVSDLDNWHGFLLAIKKQLDPIFAESDDELRPLEDYQACRYLYENIAGICKELDTETNRAAVDLLRGSLLPMKFGELTIKGTFGKGLIDTRIPVVPDPLPFHSEQRLLQVQTLRKVIRNRLIALTAIAGIIAFLWWHNENGPESREESAAVFPDTADVAADAQTDEHSVIPETPLPSETPARKDMHKFMNQVFSAIDEGNGQEYFTAEGWNGQQAFYTTKPDAIRTRTSVEKVTGPSGNEFRIQTLESYQGADALTEYQVTYGVVEFNGSYLIESVLAKKISETETAIDADGSVLRSFLKDFRVSYFDALQAGDFSLVASYLTPDGEAHKELAKYIGDIAGRGYLFEHEDFDIAGVKKTGPREYRMDTYEKFKFTDDLGEQTDYDRSKQYFIHALDREHFSIDRIAISKTIKTPITLPTAGLVSSADVAAFVQQYYSDFASAFNGGGFNSIAAYYDPKGKEFKNEKSYLDMAIEKQMQMENLSIDVVDVHQHNDNQYLATLALQDRYYYRDGTGDEKKLNVVYRIVITPEGQPLINEMMSLNILGKTKF
ncbi:TcaA NTF2-like domain-containing protein [Paenibacillus sp. URB8-2]|uniref:TcaA NTF2-like domain-containing protein n=1 Tax=Paenibacillus sp. URB8-2 TaxID=2741301 RepID=UPI0015BEE344|nr:dynamin family protein [Paenibacillus sp. URB8-2]BCG59132.1 hypothetical protein PUR_25570 [Paenibacillus sp. URB8-2]